MCYLSRNSRYQFHKYRYNCRQSRYNSRNSNIKFCEFEQPLPIVKSMYIRSENYSRSVKVRIHARKNYFCASKSPYTRLENPSHFGKIYENCANMMDFEISTLPFSGKFMKIASIWLTLKLGRDNFWQNLLMLCGYDGLWH